MHRTAILAFTALTVATASGGIVWADEAPARLHRGLPKISVPNRECPYCLT